MFSHTPFEHIPLVLEHSSMSVTRKYARYERRNRGLDDGRRPFGYVHTNLYSSVCQPTVRVRPDTRICNCPACSCTYRRGKVRAFVRTRRRLRHRKRANECKPPLLPRRPGGVFTKPRAFDRGGGDVNFQAVFPVEGEKTEIAGTKPFCRVPRSS